ncbi:hypothetical protein [Streptococcus ferus]|uniref:hypothetical protein n=1 Tax=Streptococcus ferus TaxID=1345 RepID=UPI002356F099|nr:hypothetical protein [Streptococcus ferus]
MLGDYSIMDWAVLGSILTACAGVFSVIIAGVKLLKDNQAILKRFDDLSQHVSNGGNALSKEHNILTDKLISERAIISKENESIKDDTKYLYNEMLEEKMARQNLYDNTTKAKQILDQIDIMREVVLKNAELNAKVSVLTNEISDLNRELSDSRKDNAAVKQLTSEIRGFKNQLSGLEGYREAEEIQGMLKKIMNELSEKIA